MQPQTKTAKRQADALLSLFRGGTFKGFLFDSLSIQSFQDTALATPIAADGDPVGGARDRSSGLLATQATGTAKPTIKVAAGGLPAYWSFDGGDNLVSALSGGQTMTLAACFRGGTASAYKSLMGAGAVGANIQEGTLSLDPSNVPYAGFGTAASGGSYVQLPGAIGATEDCVVIASFGPDGSWISKNGGPPVAGPPNATVASYPNNLAIGGFNHGGSVDAQYNSRIYRALAVRGLYLPRHLNAAVARALGQGVVSI